MLSKTKNKNMKKRHELRLIGITYNQIESGVYALILEEVNGERRVPIVIGFPEAQAIECKLQEVKTPRPLTHDLMKTLIETFHLNLLCVDIYKLPSGVFAANLVIEGADGEIHKLDARSSDAIALAIRTGSPIYTTADVLDEVGIYPHNRQRRSDMTNSDQIEAVGKDLNIEKPSSRVSIESFADIERVASSNVVVDDEDILLFLRNFSDKEIEVEIARFAAEEKYEAAGRLKKILNKRRQQ